MRRMRKDKDNPIDWSGFDPAQKPPKKTTAPVVVAAVAAVLIVITLLFVGGCAALADIFARG